MRTRLLVAAAMLALVVVFVVPVAAQEGGTGNNCPAFIINPAEGGQGGSPTGNTLTPTCTDVEPSQTFSQSSFESGDINPQSDITVNGDNNRVDPVVQQAGLNSGNSGTEQGIVPVDTTFGDADFTGNSFELSPSLTGGSS